MTASSMLPVLLPIALFVLTLIIIFILRAGDKRSKSLANVKKLLDIYKGNEFTILDTAGIRRKTKVEEDGE